MPVPISYSMYSSREFLPVDQTLDMLADLGYAEIEGYQDLLTEFPDFADALARRHLSMPSFHVNLHALEDNIGQTIATARKVSATHVYATYILRCDRPATEAGWQAFGRRLDKIGKVFASNGLTFGWHNHDYEFEALPDGTIPMETILAHAPNIAWQADFAWLKRSGQDPLAWLERYSDRISGVHIKDIAKDQTCCQEGGWADVGHGDMPWHALLEKSLNSNARQFVVEHGDPSDHERFAKRSIETVAGHFWELVKTPDAKLKKGDTKKASLTLVS